jgi:hypothetical protein
VGSWWERNVVEPGKLALLVCFGAFVVTFVVTRAITRLIRSGRGPFTDRVSASGVHVHHAVPGIVALVAGAFVAVGAPAGSPWRNVAAVAVGAGTSLVLDEFALILRLQDVYWSTEGRVSVEMVSVAFGCLGFALVGISPFGVDEMGSSELGVRIGAIAAGLVTLLLVVVCVMKGKFKMALFGTFVPFLAWAGAVRLARPHSPWATHRYDQRRLERAVQRAARFDARWDPIGDRVSDLIGGKPTESDPS